MLRTASMLSGEATTASDEELLDEARANAARDRAFFRSGNFSAGQAGRTFGFLQNRVGVHASAHQRARLAMEAAHRIAIGNLGPLYFHLQPEDAVGTSRGRASGGAKSPQC